MPRPKSAKFRAAAQAVSAAEYPIILVEVSHALLAEPMRFVNDVQDVVSRGQNYVATAISLIWPDDNEKQTPRAQIAFSNGRGEISAFLERTGGGRGATIKIIQIMRSAPDVIEDELILDMKNLQAGLTVTGQLGYDDVLNKAGTPYTFRPETSPGLF